MTPNTKAAGFALAGFLVAALHVQAAVTVDEYGWTLVTPSPDSRIVYVSNSEGDDANDGFSPESPKKTIRNANNFLRNGYPDHLLLKRGDVFPMENENLLLRWKNGRSQQEPLLMSYYGDSGPRPVVKIGDRFIDHDGGVGDFIAFIGIEIYRAVSDPASPEFDNRSGSTALRLVAGAKTS